MDFTPFFIFVLPIITVLTVGLLGSTRRIGFWLALILAIVLTPVGGFLVALLSGPRRFKDPKPKPAPRMGRWP
jgi:UPF0716 family protein affecting phage T7 exclusion